MQCEAWHESRHVRKGVEDEWKSHFQRMEIPWKIKEKL
jgi:hypothetical protein